MLPEFDQIIVLENGSIKACGTYSQLVECGVDLSSILPQDSDQAGNIDIAPQLQQSASSEAESKNEVDDNQNEVSVLQRVASVVSDHSELEVDGSKPLSDGPKTGEVLMTAEEKADGDVTLDIYTYYIRAGGICFAMGTLLSLMMVQVFSLGSNFYLTYWGDQSSDRESDGNPMSNKTNLQYMTVFAVLSLGAVICYILRGLFLCKSQLQSSLFMHDKLLTRVVNAPISFFDVTPTGRIVNRFSSDMTAVDEYLSSNIGQVTISVFGCLGAAVAIAIATHGTFVVLLVTTLFTLITLHVRNNYE